MYFTTPADYPALPGHFPDHPIVPGVMLLDHTLRTIDAVPGRSPGTCKVNSIKFLSPVAPGEALDLASETTSSNAVRFIIRADEREVASGTPSAPTPKGVAT